MKNKVSTRLHIDKEILETAKKVGLNISRVSENALKEAIGRLGGQEPEAGLKSPARALQLFRTC